MTGIMRACDLGQTAVGTRPCCERFSATGAEFGGPEDGYGLAAYQVEDAFFGEPREGAGESLARDTGGLGHLLPAQGRLEDDAAFGNPALLRGEVEEHSRDPLWGAAEDEVADEVFKFAGPRGQDPGEPDGAVGEAAHGLEEVVAEDGVEHAVREGRSALALGTAFQGGAEAEHGPVADHAEDLIPHLRTAGSTVELDPPLAHEVHGPRRLTLPVQSRARTELKHLGRDREVLEKPLLQSLEKLELLEPVQLGQVLDSPATRAWQPRPGRRRVLTVHRSVVLLAYTISRTLYTPTEESLHFSTALRPSGFACQHGGFAALSAFQ